MKKGIRGLFITIHEFCSSQLGSWSAGKVVENRICRNMIINIKTASKGEYEKTALILLDNMLSCKFYKTSTDYKQIKAMTQKAEY